MQASIPSVKTRIKLILTTKAVGTQREPWWSAAFINNSVPHFAEATLIHAGTSPMPSSRFTSHTTTRASLIPPSWCSESGACDADDDVSENRGDERLFIQRRPGEHGDEAREASRPGWRKYRWLVGFSTELIQFVRCSVRRFLSISFPLLYPRQCPKAVTSLPVFFLVQRAFSKVLLWKITFVVWGNSIFQYQVVFS